MKKKLLQKFTGILISTLVISSMALSGCGQSEKTLEDLQVDDIVTITLAEDGTAETIRSGMGGGKLTLELGDGGSIAPIER